MPVPFPVGEAGYSYFENAFLPERARQQWAIARKELEPLIASDTDGECPTAPSIAMLVLRVPRSSSSSPKVRRR